MRLLVLGSFLALAALPALAQSNQNPLLDVRVVQARRMEVVGRVGVYPTGSNAISFESTVCNTGQVPIPWMAPMDPDHPMFAFLVARLANGRLEQVSDRSYVKHGVQAGNSSNCGPCVLPPGPIGSSLGVGCGDVYDVGINSFQFVLGPADEVNPWLGTWSRTCSHFDRGEPPVAPPFNCDNQRSLTMAQVAAFSPIQHRLVVDDAELDLPGASFFLQCQFVTQGEPETMRGDSLGSRRFSATFDGETWQLAETGAFQFGSVLESWGGASVASATNGGDDGRVYVAVVVTGPTRGFRHYEYAIHNRDNDRGVGAFRIPICRGARVRNVGFHDVDDDPSNDWTVTVGPDEIVFETGANPLRWNSIYNVWFDSDGEAATAAVTLDAFEPGAGAPSLLVTSEAPVGLVNVFLGTGCSRATPASLYAEGSPPRATLGNTSFALASAGNPPGAESMLLVGFGAGDVRFQERCILWTGVAPRVVSMVRADASGVATHPLPVPNEPGLEGREFAFQCAVLRPGGTFQERADLSDALQVRVGNAPPGCP